MDHTWSIVVFIKQVPDADDVTIDPDTGTLNRSAAEAVMNPPDMNAVEAALEVKAETNGSVTIATMGPPGADAVLREGIGMGCDDAALISDRAFAGSDTWPTSLTLAETAKYFDADLVICGEETTDSSTGQVPPGIAAHNDWAQVTYVESVEPRPEEDAIAAKRDIEGGHEWVLADLPAVLAIGYGENDPRPAGLHRKIYAETEFEPIVLDAETLGIDPETVGLQASPTKVGGQETVEPVPRERTIADDAPELVETLKKEGILP